MDVTTRSGLGVTAAAWSRNVLVRELRHRNGDFNLAYGGQKWGNFVSVNGLNTGDSSIRRSSR